MHEVLVERGLAELARVVRVRELEDRQAVLVGVGLEDVREVGGLGLGRDAEAVRTEARETGDGVHARLGHPDGVVLLTEDGQRSEIQTAQDNRGDGRTLMAAWMAALSQMLLAFSSLRSSWLYVWRAMSVRKGG